MQKKNIAELFASAQGLNRELGQGGWYYFLRADLDRAVPAFGGQISHADTAARDLYFKCRYDDAARLAEYQMIKVSRTPVRVEDLAHWLDIEALDCAEDSEIYLIAVDDGSSTGQWQPCAFEQTHEENGFIHIAHHPDGEFQITRVRKMILRAELFYDEEQSFEERREEFERAIRNQEAMPGLWAC